MDFNIFSRTREYRSLTDVQPRQLRRLFEVWHARRPVGSIPAQADMPPSLFTECIDNVALVGLQRDPSKARYLIVGQNLKRLLGKDPTGKAVEDVYPASVAREVYQAFGKTVKSREPTFYQRDFVILGNAFGYYRLLLPLRLDGREVDRILVGIYPTSERLKDAKTWQGAALRFYRRRVLKPIVLENNIDGQWQESLKD